VLHVGDSFAESLGAPLGRRLHAAGIRSVLESKTPSYIPTWAGNGEIQRFVQKYKPDLVLITLGGNEFEIPTPADRVAPVKRLVQALGGRPCVWITPPRWKQDSGVVAVIRENSGPCRYLDSDALVHDLPLARDKIHPNEAGREQWAEAVLAWLKKERAPADGKPWALKP
jgi:lysophospholipase L1-like esterase